MVNVVYSNSQDEKELYKKSLVIIASLGVISASAQITRGTGDFSPLRSWTPYNTRRQSLGASVSSPTTFLLVRPLISA